MWSPQARESVRSQPRQLLRAATGLVVTGAIVTAVAATLYATRNPTATATSQLLLRPAIPLGLLKPVEGAEGADVEIVPAELTIDATTEAAVIATPVVARRVVQALRLSEPPEALSRSVTATAVTSSVVELQVTASDPRLAAELANSFAEQYLAYRRGSAARILARLARNLDVRASELRAQISDTDITPDERERQLALLRAIDTRAALLETFRSLHTGGGDVVKRAPLPADGSLPIATAVVGMALGGTLGAILALLRYLLGQRRTARGDLERITGMRVLSTVPMDTGSRRGWRRLEPVALYLPGSPTSNAYRILYALLAAQGVGRTLRRLLVVSLLPGQGRSTVTGNLAAMCANAGLTTLLIAADPQDSNLSRRLGLPDHQDRTASTETDLPWIARLTATETSNLLALALDHGNDGFANATAKGRLVRILDEATKLAEVVLVDAPPIGAGADAVMMAVEGFDAVLLVTPAGELDLDALIDAGWMLEQAGVPLRGMVLAEAPAATAAGR